MTQKRIIRGMRITEIAAVDSPAHKGARQVLMKRAGEEDEEAAKQAMLTTATDGHSHSINCSTYDGERCVGDTSGANDSTGRYHSHPWVMGEDGEVSIGENLGHTHAVAAMSKLGLKKGEKKADYVARFMGDEKMKSEYPDEKQRLAVAYSMHRKHVAKSSAGESAAASEEQTADDQGAEGIGEGPDMADAKSASEAEKLAAVEAEKAELAKRAAKFELMAKATDAEKAFAATLGNEADRDAFYASKPEAKSAAMAKAKDSNPVVYTSPITGEEFRKSDDPRLVAQVKRSDEMEKRQIAAEARAKDLEYAKRADDDLPFLKGEKVGGVDARVALLKAIDSIQDEGVRKAASETLKAANAALSPAFKTFGKAAGKVLAGNPHERLDEMAKQRAKDSNGKLDFAKAYREVLATDEGKELYEQGESMKRGAI